MKKLIVSALCAALSLAACAAGEQYHVYKFQLKANTTAAKGAISTACDEEYCFREKSTTTIQGIVAGCGCNAINAADSCSNAIIYMWDATRKIAITNVEAVIPWTVQRIGKKTNGVEHFTRLQLSYGENDKYYVDVVLTGFGAYHDNVKDANLSYVSSISGNFAGLANAPLFVKPGVCTACYVEEDTVLTSKAYSLCETCAVEGLSESLHSNVTPFFGTYQVRYDSTSSKNVSKKGIAALAKLLPAYVNAEDFVYTNIGE